MQLSSVETVELSIPLQAGRGVAFSMGCCYDVIRLEVSVNDTGINHLHCVNELMKEANEFRLGPILVVGTPVLKDLP